MLDSSPAATLYHAEHDLAIVRFCRTTFLRIRMHVDFVYLHIVAKWRLIVSHHQANLLKDAPSSFVSYSTDTMEL